MNVGLISLIAAGVLALFIIIFLVRRRLLKKLKQDKFIYDWRVLQSLCKDKATWPDAILGADKLLHRALKKRNYTGKRMGERMVSAQRDITNNDQLWFAHNLAKKIIADPTIKLKDTDVKAALVGFRQALRDIGALESPQSDKQLEAKS